MNSRSAQRRVVRSLTVAAVVAALAGPGVAVAAPASFTRYPSADAPGPAKPVERLVDRYGQVDSIEWPDKIRNDRQLLDDRDADAAYLRSIRRPARDAYGGDPNSRARLGLTKKGWFDVQATKDGRSVLVTPEGNQFFSLGLNSFGSVGDTYTQVKGREEAYEFLPPVSGHALSPGWMQGKGENYSFYVANQVRKFGQWATRDHWVRETERATAWGFNTAGGFSDLAQRSAAPMPYVAHLDEVPQHFIGDTRLYDVFRKGVDAELEASMRTQVSRYKNDKHLIGYMFFNEIPWSQLRTAVTRSKASEVGSKRVFVDLMRSRYSSVHEFNAAWKLEAASFDDLLEMEFAPRTEEAVADVDAFSVRYLDRFYALFAGAIRKADPNHLVLGDRLFGNVMNNDKLRRMVATAAGRHVDVLTYNYYAWDPDLDRIEEMYRLSGRPLLLTEFHYGEPTQGLTFGIRMAANEVDKGRLYRNYVEKLAASGMVVGAHWFEYLDQAATGRWFQGTDGEAGAIGLVDVTDRPYRGMLAEVMKTNHRIYDVAEGKRTPYRYAFGPSQVERKADNRMQIPRAASAPVIDGALDRSWPAGPTVPLGSTDLIDGVADKNVSGDFRFAWDAKHLYVHGTIKDPTPMLNRYHGFDIWNGDAIELFIGPRNVDQGGAIQVHDSQIIVSAQPKDAPGRLESYWYNERTDQPPISAVAKKAEGGYTIEAAIPLKDLGVDGVNPPRELRFDVGFDDGNGQQRQRQYMWNGVDGNAENREAWGRATLVDEVTSGPGADAEVMPAAATVITRRTMRDGQIVVVGTGAPKEEYVVRLDGSRLGTVTVRRDGRFDVPFDVPAGVRTGRHVVTVTHGTERLTRATVRIG